MPGRVRQLDSTWACRAVSLPILAFARHKPNFPKVEGDVAKRLEECARQLDEMFELMHAKGTSNAGESASKSGKNKRGPENKMQASVRGDHDGTRGTNTVLRGAVFDKNVVISAGRIVVQATRFQEGKL